MSDASEFTYKQPLTIFDSQNDIGGAEWSEEDEDEGEAGSIFCVDE
jgi:hypothetical protein